MRHTPFSRMIAALVLIALSAGRAAAQPEDAENAYRPLLTVSVASHEQMMSAMTTVGSMAPGDPDGTTFVTNVSKLFGSLLSIEEFDVSETAGFDAARPWGLAVISDGLDIIPYLFFPVTDVEQALATLEPLIGEAEAADDDIYIADVARLFSMLPLPMLPGAGVEMFIKQQDGWLYAVQIPDHFGVVLDPAGLKVPTEGGHDMTIDVHFRNIPEGLRTMAVDQADTLEIPGLSMTPTRLDGESEAQFEFRRQMMATFRNFATELLRDGERLTAGIKVDAEGQQFVTDVDCVAVPDTPLAKHFADLEDPQTRFGGLAASGETIMAVGLTVKLDEPRQSAMSELLEAYRVAVSELIDGEDVADTERGPFHELVDGWATIMQSSIETGNVDVGMRISPPSEVSPAWTLAAGIALPDPAAMEQLFQRLSEIVEENEGAGQVKLNVDQVGDSAIHRLSVPMTTSTSQEMRLLKKLFGELTFHFATSADAAWMAVGPNGLDELKAAIAAESTSAPPMRMAMRAAPMMPNVGLMLDSQQLGMAITLMGAQLGVGDAVNMEVTCEQNQLKMRATAGKGFMVVATTIVQLVPSLLSGGGPF